MSDRSTLNGALDGYVPANSIEAEQGTLGSMLIERLAIETARGIVDTDDFYRTEHQTLFHSICALADQPTSVDLLTLQEELKRRGKLEAIGGITYLTNLFDVTPSASNVEHYATIVKEKSLRRKLFSQALKVMSLARSSSDDIRSLISQSHDAVLSVRMDRQDDRGPATMRSIMRDVYDEIEGAEDSEEPKLTGLETGWPELDEMTGGFQPDDYVIICGDRGSGKTWTAMWSIEHCALRMKKGVYHVSQEMRRKRVGRRALSTMSGVPSQVFRTGRMSEEQWELVNGGVGQLYTDLWMVDDRPSLKPSQILQGVRDYRRWLEDQGEELGLVVVDYLQLCKPDRRYEHKHQSVSSISSELREMAAELMIPVVALSQLTRSALKTRPNKRPVPSDLAESGDIESDASLIIAPYREAFYARQAQSDEIGTRHAVADEVEMIILKSRDGDSGMHFKTLFTPSLGRYEPCQRPDDPGPTAI